MGACFYYARVAGTQVQDVALSRAFGLRKSKFFALIISILMYYGNEGETKQTTPSLLSLCQILPSWA